MYLWLMCLFFIDTISVLYDDKDGHETINNFLSFMGNGDYMVSVFCMYP